MAAALYGESTRLMWHPVPCSDQALLEGAAREAA